MNERDRYAGCEPSGPPRLRPERELEAAKTVTEVLMIAQRIEQFINDNGWSWCTMDQVYRVLKAAHQ